MENNKGSIRIKYFEYQLNSTSKLRKQRRKTLSKKKILINSNRDSHVLTR